MMHIKEKKDMDDAFKKAQKPWAKLLQKVEKTKTDYHTACKTEKSAANQERNAAGDSSFSADQVNTSNFLVFRLDGCSHVLSVYFFESIIYLSILYS